MASQASQFCCGTNCSRSMMRSSTFGGDASVVYSSSYTSSADTRYLQTCYISLPSLTNLALRTPAMLHTRPSALSACWEEQLSSVSVGSAASDFRRTDPGSSVTFLIRVYVICSRNKFILSGLGAVALTCFVLDIVSP